MRSLRALLLLAVVLAGACAPRRPTTPEGGRLLVVLGSSSAAGWGASSRRTSWAGLLAAWVRARVPEDGVWNLARAGFTTCSVMPEPERGERRRRPPNTSRNVDRALSAHPYAIVLSLPSNDTAAEIPLAEQQENFRRIAARVRAAGVRLWVLSTQPRNMSRPRRDELLAVRGFLRAEFAPRYIDVWPDLAGPDDRLRPDLDAGDGTHVNDVGHLLIAARVVAANVLERP